MNTQTHPVIGHMLSKDAFSQWMDIEVLASEAGYCRLSMRVREEMTNGFGVCHGGIIFSLADSALAFASNSRGPVSLALENNINFTQKASAGDILTAETEEIQNGRNIGVYKVRIFNQDEELVAEFRGTVYRTGEEHGI